MVERPRITLNVGKDRKTIQQVDPDDYEFVSDVEDAINEALRADRILTVTVSSKPFLPVSDSGRLALTFQGSPLPPLSTQIPEADPPKECALCDRHTGTELFSKRMKRWVHQACIEGELSKPEVSPSMLLVAAELGISATGV